VRLAVQLTGWRIDIKSESKMRELAQWLSEAVSVVEGCGDPEAELLLQQGVTSLEDLSTCDPELLTSLPGIDAAGDVAIRARAAELAVRKVEEEAARVEEERLEAIRVAEENAAAAAAAAEEAEAAAAAEEEGATASSSDEEVVATEGADSDETKAATEGADSDETKAEAGEAGADVASESPAAGDVEPTLSSTT
jgi:hypothetical protein